MAKILLGVTGSVAAIKTPELYALLKNGNHQVKIVATDAATYFFNAALIDPLHPGEPVRNKDIVHLDKDEWPGRNEGKHYERQDRILHIDLRRWADLFLIAPLDANTLAKFAIGMCDNLLTCVYRAWDLERPIILAPAMNTLMWEHPLTRIHFHQLAKYQGMVPPDHIKVEDLIFWMNAHTRKLRVVPPQTKTLACGDVGIGAMADLEAIFQMVKLNLPSRTKR